MRIVRTSGTGRLECPNGSGLRISGCPVTGKADDFASGQTSGFKCFQVRLTRYGA